MSEWATIAAQDLRVGDRLSDGRVIIALERPGRLTIAKTTGEDLVMYHLSRIETAKR